MMNNMGGDEDVDLPEVDGADDVSLNSFFCLIGTVHL
jgi:prostaglandin-E synthase